MKLRVGIPYGRETIDIRVDEQNIGEIVFPNEVKIGNEEQTLQQALANPIASKRFDEFYWGLCFLSR